MAERPAAAHLGARPVRPAVSVVIAVRNGAALLPGAFESVVSQLRADDRVVVMVGESSDDTARVARALPPGPVALDVVDQSSDGLAQARNEAVAMIEHELVAFCDADDRWTTGSLDARADAIGHDDVSAVIGSVRTMSLDGLDVPAHRRDEMGTVTPGFTPGALLARRQVFEQVGRFDEGLAIACDSDWFLRLHESGLRLERLDEVVLAKGVRPGSLSTDVVRYRSELLQAARRHTRRRAGTGPSGSSDSPDSDSPDSPDWTSHA